MRRKIQNYLESWFKSSGRKPVIVKGARQVGKSYVIKDVIKPLTPNFIEINFEKNPDVSTCFEGSLDPKEIIKKLELQLKVQILNQECTLFFDEAQACPAAITSLRYFYEDMPKLPVICAGSLIDFALNHTSVPVGRIEYAHLGPLSFEEFLDNTKNENLIRAIKEEFPGPFSPTVHRLGMAALRDYATLGGMPEIVKNHIDGNGILSSIKLQKALLDTYYDDLPKYALKSKEYQNIAEVFRKAPYIACKNFKLVEISRDIAASHIRHSLSLLEKAQILSFITSTSALPPTQFARPDRFKVLYLDIGLMQYAIRFDASRWLDEHEALLNNGSIAEQFVGQELSRLNTPDKMDLFYWERLKKNSTAEVDYLLQINSTTLPIEVKSMAAGRLNSLKLFMENYKEVPFGIRLCGLNSEIKSKFISLPHYALPELHSRLSNMGIKDFIKNYGLE